MTPRRRSVKRIRPEFQPEGRTGRRFQTSTQRMTSDNQVRDVRIGLRVLLKEKSFCALAVIVLALGIAGVTTMFSMVNGIMLRGFSFPNADRLVSLNFIDPTSAT